MPKRDADLLLGVMVESCKNIFDYTKGMDFDDFINDRKTRDAVIRNFEVLGEASRNVPEAICSANPQIEWRKIGDFRNVLIHAYSASITRRCGKSLKMICQHNLNC